MTYLSQWNERGQDSEVLHGLTHSSLVSCASPLPREKHVLSSHWLKNETLEHI